MEDSFAVFFQFAVLIGFLFIVLFLCWCVGRFSENRGGSFLLGFLASFFLSPILGFFIVFLITSGHRAVPQVTASMTSEDFVRTEQIKLEMRRMELRWRFFYNLLFIVLLIGGAYFIYHNPGPLRPLRDNIFSISPATQSKPATDESADLPTSTPEKIPVSLPRDVVLTRDMTSPVPKGVIGVRKGQIVRLLSKNGERYSGQYAGVVFSLSDADFKEK